MIPATWESECGRAKLWLGDCLEVMATWPSGSASAVVTDPPYGIDYQSARRIDRAQWKPKIANDTTPFVWFLPQAARIAPLTLCFCRWDVQEAFRSAMAWAGMCVRSQVIWDRCSHGMGDLNGTPAPQHDVIWMGVSGDYTLPGKRPTTIVRSQRLPGDALEHPNEKPVDLMEALVGSYSPADAVIVDPFAGSGATGVAAIRLGRSFWGCEIEPKYFELATRRIQAELDRYVLFDGGGEQQRLFENPR